MSLYELKNNYQLGNVTKPDYIEEMYHYHQILFEYKNILSKTDIKSIDIQAEEIIFTSRSRGIKIACQNLDKRIAAIEILNFNFYEKKDSEMIFNLLEKDYIIFDIGANIGWYSLNIAQQFPESQIFAFEPIPATFNLLKRNVELNNYHNISIYNWGFSDQNQEIIFYLHQDTSVSASAVNLYEGKDFAQVICQVKKLDDYAEQIKPKIDFIKCDVEGAELFVYQGGIETIKRNKPIIFTEMLRKWSAKFNYHPNEIIKFFGALGYRCFTVNETNLWEFFIMDDYTVETNFFFLHSVNHAEKIAQFIAR